MRIGKRVGPLCMQTRAWLGEAYAEWTRLGPSLGVGVFPEPTETGSRLLLAGHTHNMEHKRIHPSLLIPCSFILCPPFDSLLCAPLSFRLLH